eukprot:15477178-Alexandrium_andersonii.AAC.2
MLHMLPRIAHEVCNGHMLHVHAPLAVKPYGHPREGREKEPEGPMLFRLLVNVHPPRGRIEEVIKQPLRLPLARNTAWQPFHYPSSKKAIEQPTHFV